MNSFLSCSYEELRLLNDVNDTKRVGELQDTVSLSPSFDSDVWNNLAYV